MSPTRLLARPKAWVLSMGLVAVLASSVAGASYVRFESVSASDQGDQPADLNVYRLPNATGPVTATVTAFGYVDGEGAGEREYLYIRLELANGGDYPLTVDPAGTVVTDDLGRRIGGATLYDGETPLDRATVWPGGRRTLHLALALPREVPFDTMGSILVEWPYTYGDETVMATLGFLKTGRVAAPLAPEAGVFDEFAAEPDAPLMLAPEAPLIYDSALYADAATTYVEPAYWYDAYPTTTAVYYVYDYSYPYVWGSCLPHMWRLPWYRPRRHGFTLSFSLFGDLFHRDRPHRPVRRPPPRVPRASRDIRVASYPRTTLNVGAPVGRPGPVTASLPARPVPRLDDRDLRDLQQAAAPEAESRTELPVRRVAPRREPSRDQDRRDRLQRLLAERLAQRPAPARAATPTRTAPTRALSVQPPATAANDRREALRQTLATRAIEPREPTMPRPTIPPAAPVPAERTETLRTQPQRDEWRDRLRKAVADRLSQRQAELRQAAQTPVGPARPAGSQPLRSLPTLTRPTTPTVQLPRPTPAPTVPRAEPRRQLEPRRLSPSRPVTQPQPARARPVARPKTVPRAVPTPIARPEATRVRPAAPTVRAAPAARSRGPSAESRARLPKREEAGRGKR